MKILCISDTHNRHNVLQCLPEADVIIHAGDFCSRGYREECVEFFRWFASLNYKHKICIAGNHDFYMENLPEERNDEIIPLGIHYLNDSGCEIEGVKFWGSPVQPTFYNWAFNRERGSEIQKHWEKIPNDTDVLITHGPAYGYLDLVYQDDENVGCSDLLRTTELIKPIVHICGHIHAHGGMSEMTRDTLFINASICDESYQPVNKPVLIDLEVSEDKSDVSIITF